MSEATAEFLERFFEAFDSHDESTLLDLVHPDVEFTSLIVEVEGDFRGREGLRHYLSELFTAFPDFQLLVSSPTGLMETDASDQRLADRVLAIFAAWNRGDFEGWAALAHPKVEFRPEMVGQLEGVVFRGRDGLRRFWDEWHELWDVVQVSVDQREWLGTRLLVLGGVTARGRQSGVAVNAPLAWLIEFEGQQIRRASSYLDEQAARDAAGRSA